MRGRADGFRATRHRATLPLPRKGEGPSERSMTHNKLSLSINKDSFSYKHRYRRGTGFLISPPAIA